MRFKGFVDRCEPYGVDGWVYDPGAPLSRVRVEFLLGEAKLGECVADLRRDDLVAAGISDGHVAFVFVPPPFLPQASLTALRVRVAGTDFVLDGPAAAQTPVPAAVRAEAGDFGGLWIDRADWLDRLAFKHRQGTLDEAATVQIFRFVRDGYLVIPGAVAQGALDALNGEIERMWRDPPAGMLIETAVDGAMRYIAPELRYRAGATKLLDLFAASAIARRVTAAEPCVRFLSAIFAERPKAFQQLAFWNGSQQAMHKDTAYVKIDSNPLALAATWLALEDVRAGAGELEYFVGSHRAPHYLFGGVSKWMEGHAWEHDRFLASLHADAERLGHSRQAFHGKAGDVLVWHGDLAHGGSRITVPGVTRRSLVTHFTGAGEVPYYCRGGPRAGWETAECLFVSEHGEPV